MTAADDISVPPRATARPRLERCRVGDRVLLGISAVVDEPLGPHVAQVSLAGELCPASAPKLSEVFHDLLDEGITQMHVDLAQLTLCTAAGANLFDEMTCRLAARGGSLELTNATGVVHRVLQVSGIPHHRSSAD